MVQPPTRRRPAPTTPWGRLQAWRHDPNAGPLPEELRKELEDLLESLLPLTAVTAEPGRAAAEARASQALRTCHGGAAATRIDELLEVLNPTEDFGKRLRRRAGMPGRFSAVVLRQAEAVADVDPLGPLRQDLSHLEALTLDGRGTPDLDDALSWDGQQLHVHVTDVGSRLQPGTSLWAEALRRATSHYLPDGPVPMLPPLLSQGAWSLQAGELKRVVTHTFVRQGDRLELVAIEPALIRVRANLWYEDVDARDPPLDLPDFAWLQAWVQRRRHERKADRLSHVPADLQVSKGRIEVVPRPEVSPSRRLIEELALLTSAHVSRWARGQGLPLIHRLQDVTGDGRFETAAWVVAARSDRHRAAAEQGRWFAHVTSPLRRFLDVVNQRQVLASLSSGQLQPLSQSRLQGLLTRVRPALDRSAALEAEARRLWLVRWYAQRPGQVVPAEGDGPGRCTLLDTGLRVRLRGEPARVGERLSVRVTVDAEHQAWAERVDKNSLLVPSR